MGPKLRDLVLHQTAGFTQPRAPLTAKLSTLLKFLSEAPRQKSYRERLATHVFNTADTRAVHAHMQVVLGGARARLSTTSSHCRTHTAHASADSLCYIECRLVIVAYHDDNFVTLHAVQFIRNTS